MTKRLLTLFTFILTAVSAMAQIMDPVSWSTKAQSNEDGSYTLFATAKVDAPWHIYGLTIPEGGPMATAFDFEKGNYTLDGAANEPKPEVVYDPNFKMDITLHSGTVVFSQRVKTASGTKHIKAEVTYMACNDEQCLAPETAELSFNLPAQKVKSTAVVEEKTTPTNTSVVTADAEQGVEEEEVNVVEEEDAVAVTVAAVENAPVVNENSTASAGLWKTFFFAFIAGLLALLTPCVFPMIPMTVSFFMKRYKDRAKGIRDAMLYGVSIILIYLILGVGVSAIFGASALNELSTDPWFNLFFFVLLLVFAASFLGAFELTMPSSWVNKMDKNSDKAGLVGIFFMAFTLALVSFSCTGPFVGTVLVEAATTGNFWGPIVGMIGFSGALALPFTLFAIFPSWLSGLPKSGGWLNSVKVVLGFIELAFALKFLSNTDMVWDMRILTREVFIALWVVIFTLLGFYLLGKIRLPHDSPMESISVSRLFMSIVTLSFAVYMLPGIWGSPVKIISAFAPPLEYSETGGKTVSASSATSMSMHMVDGLHEGPQGIPVFTDLDKARAYAKGVGKPLLADFTGKACVNCRKMESDVWSDETVKQMLTNDFVVVELFVDFREALPESEQYVSESGKKIKTVGQKWSDYQIRRFGINAQPYYVILDDDDNVIAPTRGLDTSIPAYVEWLNNGLSAYKK
ncbi:MAG: cytochrome c biogenesis protein CcdA [Flavobacteriales bacterium]|nr:cytochrome c biogenesis protein CcdA [Flavobacteriales bacterium]